ncbi:MAG: PKD domain-containing protein [Saprospiraceae bacterium]|nr:PKD domain-containing protein [Saprospiraceae bacterium]
MHKSLFFPLSNQPRFFTPGYLRVTLSLFLLTMFAWKSDAQPCSFSVAGTTTTPCEFAFVSHVSGVDGYFIEHHWDFGDGSTSDVANPVVTYPSFAFGGPTQSYTVTHTVRIRDPFTLLEIPGSPFVCSQTVQVTSSQSCLLCPPQNEEQPSIFIYHVTGCDVQFHATLGNWYNYTWSFGDLGIGAGENTSHTYANDGVYNVGLGAQFGTTSFRCTRKVTVDCTRPSSEFTWTTGGNGCDCFALNLIPEEQTPGATYGWYLGDELVATGPNPDLFKNGIDICKIQQEDDGKIKVSLVVQLNGESSPLTTKEIDLSGVTPAIYIGYSGGTTNLSDCEDVLPGSSYCGTCMVKVCGIVNVDKSFEFCGSEVEFAPGNTGFDVSQDKTLSLTGGAHFHGCECIWRGVKMLPQSSIVVSGSSIIEDAGYAIDVTDNLMLSPVNLSLSSGIFRNNYIGVRITGRASFSAFTQNLFTTSSANTPPLWPDCKLLLPGTFSRNIGFAGMYIDPQGSAINLPNDNNQNLFKNLAVGIYTANSVLGGSLTLDHTASFDMINSCTEYQSDRGGTSVYFFNLSNFTATGNAFTRVKTGIVGETAVATNVNITNNAMNAGVPSVARGIQLIAKQPGEMDGTISGNAIKVDFAPTCLSAEDAFGISFADVTTASNNLLITQNPITLNCAIAQTEGILLTGGPLNTPASIEVDVDDNTITAQQASSGIELRTMRRVAVHGNTMNLSGTFSIMGIVVNGTESSKICFNTVNNTTGNNRGLQIIEARYNDYVNNVLNNTSVGAAFSGDCDGANFACNQFNGNQGTGLRLFNTAKIGVQNNTGNTWNGTFSGFPALISLPNAFFNDNIFVVPAAPSPFNPNNTQQQGGVFWFDDTQGVTGPDCNNAAYNCMGYNRPENTDYATERAGRIKTSLTLEVAPNPNQGECLVYFGNLTEPTATVQIVSLSGSLVQKHTVSAGQTALNITDLTPGIYFVSLITNGGASVPKKVIVF